MTEAGAREPLPTVTFVCPKLDSGGAESHWRDLIIALDHGLAKVSLVTLNETGRAFDQVSAAGIPAKCIGLPYGFRALGSLIQLIQAIPDPTGSLVTWEPNAAIMGALAARARGGSHIVNWHRGPGSTISTTQRMSLRVASRLDARAIAVSKSQVHELETFGFRPERISVIPNGTVVSEFTDVARSEARARLQLPEGAFICLLVGRLSEEKRVDRFIEGIRLAAARNDKVIGIVVGDGPIRGRLASLAEDAGCSTSLVGYSDEAVLWMRAADVVCLTSDREALPVALIEAASCRRPLIGPDIGGVGEVIENGNNGFLVEGLTADRLARCIGELVADTSLAETMGERARLTWIQRFSHDQMVHLYLEEFRRADFMSTHGSTRSGREAR